MRAADDDPQKYKAFRASHEGVVHGIQFNTSDMTWQLPQGKLSAFLHLISISLSAPNLSLNKVEVLFGKLIHFVQHAPAMVLLTAKILDFLRDILSQHPEGRTKEEDDHTYRFPVLMKHDLQTIGAIVRLSKENPLPIMAPH